jgi:hypothetical protein
MAGLAALAAGAWLLAAYGGPHTAVAGLDAPPGAFSAMRAKAALTGLLGAEPKARPLGSAENAAVHARLLRRLEALGAAPQTLSGRVCEHRRATLACGHPADIIAAVRPGTGKAIVMMAHMDSVAAGPGASDDGSGVGALLETIRALKTETPAADAHPVLALFTDGEESGLLGARLFVDDPAWRRRIGMVINLEARGTRGDSLLFQTGPGAAPLIDLYADAARHYATSSLFAEIYRHMPNDTDFTPFLGAGLTGYNFAFIGGAANYHTPGDTVQRLDPRSLQQHGDNLLALVRALETKDLARLTGGEAIYLDVLGRWLPRLPQRLALPLALVVLAAFGVAAGMVRPGWRAWAMPPALSAGAVTTGFALYAIAALVSGQPDPAFAHPALLRAALGLGVGAAALAAGYLATGAQAAVAVWTWLALLGVLAAVMAPGASPYFLFPGLVAAILLPFGRRWPQAAILLAALAALPVWMSLAVRGEDAMGLAIHPLFTLPVGFGLLVLMPLLPRMGRGWPLVTAGLAVAAAVVAGFAPAYSADAPQRLNLQYVERDGRAVWRAGPVSVLPKDLAAYFPSAPGKDDYVAAAGRAHLAPPTARMAAGRLRITGSAAADAFILTVPQAAGLRAVEVAGKNYPPAATIILPAVPCPGRPCRMAEIGLSAARPFTLTLTEQRRGLPPEGSALLRARGDAAVPSRSGDRTEIITEIRVP